MRPPHFFRQCLARSKRSGQQCRNYAVRDRHVCRMHGGRTPRGCLHPRFKSGKHGKHSIGWALAVCPKCRKQHDGPTQQEREDRIYKAAYHEGHMHGAATGQRCGYQAGYHDGYAKGERAGADRAYKHMSKKRRSAEKTHAKPSLPATGPAPSGRTL